MYKNKKKLCVLTILSLAVQAIVGAIAPTITLLMKLPIHKR